MSLLLSSLAGLAMTQSSHSHVITGTVTFRERIALTPRAEVTVFLDMMDGDQVIRISTVRMLLSGKQVPVAYTLPFTVPDRFAKRKFTVGAEIKDSDYGFWSTAKGVSVKVTGNAKVNMSLVKDAGAPAWAGPTWNLTSIMGNSVKVLGRAPMIKFDFAKREFQGHTGVNGLGGKFSWDSPTLQIDPGPMTMMAGSEEQMAVERNLLQSLQQVNRVEMRGNILILLRDDRELLRYSRGK